MKAGRSRSRGDQARARAGSSVISVPKNNEPSRDEMRCRACGAWSEASADRCNRCGRAFGQRPRTLLRGLEEAESLPAPPPAPPAAEKPRDVEWRNELQKRLASYRENQSAQPTSQRGKLERGPKPALPPIRDSASKEQEERAEAKLPPLTRRLAHWKRGSGADPEPRATDDAPGARQTSPPIVDLRPLRQEQRAAPRRPAALPMPAPVSMRAVAGLMDIGLALLASGLFAAATHLLAPASLEGEGVAQLLAVAFFLILQFYWFSFVRFAGRTAGMSWLGLQVVNFDGEPPDDAQRWQRAFGTSLSATALGLGFAWAVADEQTLTWHDRMSKTLVVAPPQQQE